MSSQGQQSSSQFRDDSENGDSSQYMEPQDMMEGQGYEDDEENIIDNDED